MPALRRARSRSAQVAPKIVKSCTKTPAYCPACYSGGDCSIAGQAGFVVASLEVQLDAFVPAVACEETVDKATAKCIDGNAKLLQKLSGAINKYYDKCYANAQKGKIPGGSCLPVASDPATAACIAKARAKATTTFDKVCTPGTKPACYHDGVNPPAVIPSPSSGVGWASLVQLAVDSTVPQTYCGP